VALFWPDADQEHARRALNRASYYLRHELAPGVLETRGDDELAVAEDRVWCDVVAFDRALSEGRLEDALELYRGEFLPGFFVSGVPEFERWVEVERARLRDRAVDAALRLATQEAAAHRVADAERWARHASALAPHDERAVRRRLELLDRAGDRAGALRTYEEFARQLREELDADPSPETQATVAAIRARREPATVEGDGVAPVAVVRPWVGAAARPTLSRASAVRAGLWGFALLLGGAAAYVFIAARAPGLDAYGRMSVVAVLPFRVASADASLAYLHEGMAELLASELTGEGGPTSVDAASVLRAWTQAGGTRDVPLDPEAARRVAGALGADLVVDGSVVGAPGSVRLTARMVRIRDGAPRGPPVQVGGPTDSLPALVARLAVSMLERWAGRGAATVGGVGTRSVQAMRAYLAGLESYRRAHYVEAAGHLETAVELDSAYVPAAFWLAVTGGWIGGVRHGRRVQEIAWNGRQRLGARQRGLLEAFLGVRFPDPSPYQELLALRERYAMATPLSHEAWYFVGDTYLHWGAFLGLDDALRRASNAFERSIALDTTAGTLAHLLEVAVLEHDTAAVRRWWSALVGFAPPVSNALRWIAASALGDEAMLREAHHAADSMGYYEVQAINVPQYAGLPMAEVDAAIQVAERRSVTRRERFPVLFGRFAAACNAGRPGKARETIRDIAEGHEMRRDVHLLFLARYCGDTAGIAAVEARMEAVAAVAGEWQGTAACMLGRWYAASGRPGGAARALQRLRGSAAEAVPFPPQGGASRAWGELCVHLLTALVAARPPGGQRELARFDSLMRTGPRAAVVELMNFEVARAWAELGDMGRALAAVRRRAYLEAERPYALAPMLLDEGRWAGLTGDHTGAMRACRHYLALRSEPEPTLIPQRDSVLVELARLEVGRP